MGRKELAIVEDSPKGVHPLACVEGAFLCEGTRVWQFASLIRGARIGKDCNIGSGALVDGAVVGDGVLIGAGAQLHPGTRVGSNVFIGPGVICCNDRWPHVGKQGFDVQQLLDGSIVTVDIEDAVSIGAGAIILPGVKIGRGSTVAAGAIVQDSVPVYSLHKRSGEVVPISARVPERMRGAV